MKHTWLNSCRGRNRVMFECRFVYFKTIHECSQRGSLHCYDIHLWRHEVAWDCDVIADVGNGWGEWIIPIGGEICAWNIRFDSRLSLPYFLDYFVLHVIKGVKNGCLCRVSDQGTTLRASDLHNARATILNPINQIKFSYYDYNGDGVLFASITFKRLPILHWIYSSAAYIGWLGRINISLTTGVCICSPSVCPMGW